MVRTRRVFAETVTNDNYVIIIINKNTVQYLCIQSLSTGKVQ